MNEQLVKQLVSLFLNWPLEELNVVDWSFNNNILLVKIEADDGMVEVYSMEMQDKGYASSLRTGDFSVIPI